MIVAACENMSYVSTRSYKKVTSILHTIAKVKLCLVMLDLECDTLVVEMFQSFLKMIVGDVFATRAVNAKTTQISPWVL